MLCSDFYCLLQPKVLNLTIVLTNNLICVSNQRMITPMFEHVTRAHAGTRHVSHEEHAPLAYFASRSLSQFLTPALRFFPTFLSFFLFVSHTISFFLLSSVSFFSSCQIQMYSVLIRSYFASSLLSLFAAVLFVIFPYVVILSLFQIFYYSRFQDRILFTNLYICCIFYTYILILSKYLYIV